MERWRRSMVRGQSGSERPRWSEGAAMCLLDAYESKWALRNPTKLKGRDWEDVSRVVSSRDGSNAKTATQCKNKVESMKKRYRNESAAGDGGTSTWPLFRRLDSLVRWKHPSATAPPPQPNTSMEKPSNVGEGATRLNKICKEVYWVDEMKRKKKKMMKGKVRDDGEDNEVVKSIQWLLDIVLKVEQKRIDTVKEVQRMRVEAEAWRGEMDLKRFKIIAETQLQLAKFVDFL